MHQFEIEGQRRQAQPKHIVDLRRLPLVAAVLAGVFVIAALVFFNSGNGATDKPPPSQASKKIGIIGSGNFATAMAVVIAAGIDENVFDPKVKMFVRSSEVAATINAEHKNAKYGSWDLPSNVVATSSLADICASDYLVWTVAHEYAEDFLSCFTGGECKYGPNCQVKPDAQSISLMKGGFDMDTTTKELDLGSSIISQRIHNGRPVAVMMGANIAKEIGYGKFAEGTIGCRTAKEVCDAWVRVFGRKQFQVAVVPDAEAVELLGGLKNIIALAAGQVEGCMRDNVHPELTSEWKAAVIAAGLRDMYTFIKNMFPKTSSATFLESAGIADLMATCYGGRNLKCGTRFGELLLDQGGSLDPTAKTNLWDQIEKDVLQGQSLQGTKTILELYPILEELNLTSQVPIISGTYQSAFREGGCDKVMADIRNRAEGIQKNVNSQSSDASNMHQKLFCGAQAIRKGCTPNTDEAGACNNVLGAYLRRHLATIPDSIGLSIASLSEIANDLVLLTASSSTSFDCVAYKDTYATILHELQSPSAIQEVRLAPSLIAG